MHAVLGPNGAGKTTLVRILSTLLRPDGGRIRVAGHDACAEARAVRRRIGLLGQYAALDEQLDGRQDLEMFARLHHLGARHARVRATELLERFGLTGTGRTPVARYSGGMRRRLDLAASRGPSSCWRCSSRRRYGSSPASGGSPRPTGPSGGSRWPPACPG